MSARRIKKGWRCSDAGLVGTAVLEIAESFRGVRSSKTVSERNSKTRSSLFALLSSCLAEVGIFLFLLTFLSYIVPFFPAMLTVPSVYLSPTVRTQISISNLFSFVLNKALKAPTKL